MLPRGPVSGSVWRPSQVSSLGVGCCWRPVGGGRDAAKCPTRYRTIPTAKMNVVLNVKSTKVEKPAVR